MRPKLPSRTRSITPSLANRSAMAQPGLFHLLRSSPIILVSWSLVRPRTQLGFSVPSLSLFACCMGWPCSADLCRRYTAAKYARYSMADRCRIFAQLSPVQFCAVCGRLARPLVRRAFRGSRSTDNLHRAETLDYIYLKRCDSKNPSGTTSCPRPILP